MAVRDIQKVGLFKGFIKAIILTAIIAVTRMGLWPLSV